MWGRQVVGKGEAGNGLSIVFSELPSMFVIFQLETKVKKKGHPPYIRGEKADFRAMCSNVSFRLERD